MRNRMVFLMGFLLAAGLAKAQDAGQGELVDGFSYAPEAIRLGPGEIRGKLVDAAGKTPFTKLTVRLIDSKTGKLVTQTQTAEDGSFSLGRQPPATYLVTVGAFGRVQGYVKVEEAGANEPFTLEMPAKYADGATPAALTATGVKDPSIFTTGVGVMKGSLLDSDGSTPLKGVPIRLVSKADDKTLRRVETDDKGNFDLGDLPDGQYVVAMGTATVEFLVIVVVGLTPQQLVLVINNALLAAGVTGQVAFAGSALVVTTPLSLPAGLGLLGAIAAATPGGLAGVGVAVAAGVAIPVAVAIPIAAGNKHNSP